jgi:hypothetical protein
VFDTIAANCRYDQLEAMPAYELKRVFAARDAGQPPHRECAG